MDYFTTTTNVQNTVLCHLWDNGVIDVTVKAADSGGRQTWNQPPRPSWRSVPNNTELDEPGWTPRLAQSRARIPVITLRQQPQHPPPAPHHRQYPHLQSIRHIEEEPAWYGSLKSATDSKLTDRKVLV